MDRTVTTPADIMHEFPGWYVWTVPTSASGAQRWCARKAGDKVATVDAWTPAELREAMTAKLGLCERPGRGE